MNFLTKFFKYTTIIHLGLTFLAAIIVLLMSCVDVSEGALASTIKVLFAPGSFFFMLEDLTDADSYVTNMLRSPIISLVSSMMWAAVVVFIMKLASNKEETPAPFKLGVWGLALVINLVVSLVLLTVNLTMPNYNVVDAFFDCASPVFVFIIPLTVFALIPSSLPLLICCLLAVVSDFNDLSASSMLLTMPGFCVAAFALCISLACVGLGKLWKKVKWLFFVILGVLFFVYSIFVLLFYVEYKDRWDYYYDDEYSWDSDYEYNDDYDDSDSYVYEGDEEYYDEEEYGEEYYDESDEDFTYDTDDAEEMLDYLLDETDLPNVSYLQNSMWSTMSWAHNSFSGEYSGNQERVFKAIRKFSRDADDIQSFYDTYSFVFYAAVSKDTYEGTVLKSYIDGLVEAYDDITAQDGYESKLNSVFHRATRWNDSYIQEKHYNLIKDFVSEDMLEKFPDSNHDDLVFLYTFWARRNSEGNMSTVHDVLTQIQAHYAD